MSDKGPAKSPCGSCPYRKDVPSGVWHPEEYAKLPLYDQDTGQQPMAAFFCHQQNERLCAGWVGCHDMDNNLSLRLGRLGGLTPEDVEAARDYESPVPLWESGEAAAEHGMALVESPDDKAQRTIQRLSKKLNQKRRTM